MDPEPRRARLEVNELTSRHVGPCSLTLYPGECASLGGPSGGGKSLLLRAIADLDPNTGEVLLDQQPRERYPPTDWRRLVGYLPADSGWWGERVGEHFRARPDGQRLARLGLPRDAPDWSVERLSSGERQRLALLRLLENEPAVLLLDEATANLDPDSQRNAETLILEYLSTRATCSLWVSHDAAQRERLAGRRFWLGDDGIQEAPT